MTTHFNLVVARTFPRSPLSRESPRLISAQPSKSQRDPASRHTTFRLKPCRCASHHALRPVTFCTFHPLKSSPANSSLFVPGLQRRSPSVLVLCPHFARALKPRPLRLLLPCQGSSSIHARPSPHVLQGFAQKPPAQRGLFWSYDFFFTFLHRLTHYTVFCVYLKLESKLHVKKEFCRFC